MEIKCPQCGFSRPIPENKIPAGSVIARCPRCACRFRFSAQDGAGEILPPGADAEEDICVTASNAYAREAERFENERRATQAMAEREKARNPWQDAPEPDGWFTAFYRTIIRVMFQAPQFFRTLAPDAQLMRPLAFFIIICIFQTLVERAWGQALYSFLSSGNVDDSQLQEMLKLLAPSSSILLALLLRTGVLLIQLFIFSFLMYLVYRILAPGRATFMLVYQAMAYSAAPWVLCIVPGLGSIAGAIWGVCCLAIACRVALKLNWGQTFAGFLPLIAVLLPLILQLMRGAGQGT